MAVSMPRNFLNFYTPIKEYLKEGNHLTSIKAASTGSGTNALFSYFRFLLGGMGAGDVISKKSSSAPLSSVVQREAISLNFSNQIY